MIPLHETGWKEYIRHNRYCTPWYRDQFMEINTYENKQQTFRVEDACVYQGDHVILCAPEDFLADETDAGQARPGCRRPRGCPA